MRPDAALAGLRIGCVQYLNARPLIYGCGEPVVFDHPSGLAAALAADELDVALVPIFEALRSMRYALADGIAIASDGPVFSVFLAYRGRLEDIREIALDPASLTSVHLLQVLLAEYHGLKPRCVDAAHSAATPQAMLLIGNQAIEFREKMAGGWAILDLGEEWTRRTRLPFVYAAWLLHPGLANAPAVADALRSLKTRGLAHLPEIIRAEPLGSADFRTRYLTEHIRFDLGDREKAGIEKFRRLLVSHGFIQPSEDTLIYV